MSNENIKKAKEVYDKLQNDEHERYLAELREKYILDKNWYIESGREEGREEGIEIGMEKGKEAEREKIIQRLKDEGKLTEELEKIIKDAW